MNWLSSLEGLIQDMGDRFTMKEKFFNDLIDQIMFIEGRLPILDQVRPIEPVRINAEPRNLHF